MPETYKSFATALGTTAATTIYSGTSGSAIVNGVVFSNIHASNGTTITLEIVKGTTGFSLITNGDVPIKSSLQALDTPVVLETNNTLRATAGATGSIHAVVSVLEIT